MQAFGAPLAAAIAALLAAALPSAAAAAASDRAASCMRGAGLADNVRKELGAEDSPPAVGFLQERAGRAQPPAGPRGAAKFALLAAQAPAEWQIPFGDLVNDVKNSIPSQKVMDAAEAGTLASALNATLRQLYERAEQFLATASEHQESLLRSVSAKGVDAVRALGELVTAEVGPVNSSFGAVTEVFRSQAPILAAAMHKLGFGRAASRLQAGADEVMEEARRIQGRLDNASDLAAALGNATEEEIEPLVLQLNAEIHAGLDAAASLNGELLNTLQGTLSEVESLSKTTATAESAFDSLDETMTSILLALKRGLEQLFRGVEKATGSALATVRRSRSESGAVTWPLPLGLLLPASGLFFGERLGLCRLAV